MPGSSPRKNLTQRKSNCWVYKVKTGSPGSLFLSFVEHSDQIGAVFAERIYPFPTKILQTDCREGIYAFRLRKVGFSDIIALVMENGFAEQKETATCRI